MLPINLDGDKCRTQERCTFFIGYELKDQPHENPACVLFTWTILPMEMDSDFKNMNRGR